MIYQRFYKPIIETHFKENRQMLFLMGLKGVGKTTLALTLQKNGYYDWTNSVHRKCILAGPACIAKREKLQEGKCALIIFDGIQEYPDWRGFLKGFYDSYPHMTHILVLGSIDLSRIGNGDGLVGRYFSYHVHPLSLRELIDPVSEQKEIHPPQPIEDTLFENLWNFGGFPDPFFKKQIAGERIDSFKVYRWSKDFMTCRSRVAPKSYLWDWAQCDKEKKAENFIVSHLLKAVHFWTDYGFGDFELYYLHYKNKREDDFIVTKDDEPWMLVEVKASRKQALSPSLKYFQEMTGAPYAFQVALDKPYVDKSCFVEKRPMIVSARTFLSQLV